MERYRLIWLGEQRGMLSDWVTQQWVRATGKRILLAEQPWLDGPVGSTTIIGKEFFAGYAAANGLEIVQAEDAGLMPDFDSLADPARSMDNAAEAVRHFYEHTAEYELDAWSEWSSFFRPFGRALAVIFSRRLQQLNVPLSAMDSAAGMSSQVLPMRSRSTGQIMQTAWVRELRATRNVIYAGSYSTTYVPGHPYPCVKVVFPLPNGSAMVLMKVEVGEQGDITLISDGKAFGDPGFYFVVHGKDGQAWARYVASMKESIHVYAAESGASRADHELRIWGRRFLRLHYRMRRPSL